MAVGSKPRMFCPRCGEPLAEVNGALTCVRGDMSLSPKMRECFTECFVTKTRTPADRVFELRVGGRWFCPGCGVQALEQDGRITCPRCSRSLNEFIGSLVELHRHRR